MTDRIEQIARELTPGQSRALMGLPVNRSFVPGHTGFQWPVISALKGKTLVRGLKDGFDGMGPTAPCVVTPTGRLVRAWLMNNDR